MNKKCSVCGNYADFWVSYKGQIMCINCKEKLKLEDLVKEGEKVSKASDFKGWDHGDMSDLFWYHLGEYVKDRNPEAHFGKMKSALHWAFHDSHGLSSSFCHALKWAGVSVEEVLDWCGY